MSTGASCDSTMRLFLLFTLMIATAACGGDGTTRVCFGTDDFCGRVFGRNLPPQADAGVDQQVASGALVQLDGSASRDSDGHIAAFAWTQEAGPPVALEQATAPVAAFEAPVVPTTTLLTFRLLVTDNRGASDIDRVRVTVTPGSAGALDRGLQLLKEPIRPGTAAVVAECADCRAFVGLWLGARIAAVAAARDDDVDRLLDALRTLTLTHSGYAGATHPPPTATPQQGLLAELGWRSVAAFTAERDPATAELARRLSPQTEPVAPVAPEAWAAAITGALPELAGDDASLAELQRAGERLLLAVPGSDPPAIPVEWLAAATLVLALQAEASARPLFD